MKTTRTSFSFCGPLGLSFCSVFLEYRRLIMFYLTFLYLMDIFFLAFTLMTKKGQHKFCVVGKNWENTRS